MPLAERRERHASMLEVVRRNDVRAWHERFVAALRGARARSDEHWKNYTRQQVVTLR